MRPLLSGLLPRLFASIILPFSVVLFALAFAAIGVHEKAMRGLVAERDARSVRAAAAAISEVLLHRQIAVRELALRLQDGVSPARLIREAGSLAHDFPEGLAVVSRKGRIVAGFLPAFLSGSGLLERALASPGGADGLLPPLASPSGAVVTAAFTDSPLLVAGAFSTVNLLRFALPDLGSPPGRASAVIVDPEQGVLAYDGALPPETDYRDHPGIQAALQGKSGSSYVNSLNGEEHVLAFSPIPNAGWVLLLEEPWNSVVSPALRLSLVSPLAFVPALVISVIALWLAARQIVVPLRSLRRQALKLAAGDFSAIEEKLGGVQEIRELQHGMAVMARRIQSAQQSLRRYIGRVTYAQEEERRRLAQDLHDETIQDLIALDQKIQLAGRSRNPEEGPRTPGLEAIHREAQKAIQKVRRLSRALRPAYLEDLGLLPALEALAGDVGSSIGIPISVRAEGSQSPLPREADLAVYRIVQEALANVARHAAAHHVWITLRYRREELLVNVKDDGAGFAPPLETADLSRSGHFGLIGMQERAQYIGARLEVHSRPGKGTRITLYLPLCPPESPSRP
jgi:signal transduction histidine kinase